MKRAYPFKFDVKETARIAWVSEEEIRKVFGNDGHRRHNITLLELWQTFKTTNRGWGGRRRSGGAN